MIGTRCNSCGCNSCGWTGAPGAIHACGGRNDSGGVSGSGVVRYSNECQHENAFDSVDDRGAIHSHCRKCGRHAVDLPPPRSADDARAQLWARVYAAEYEQRRRALRPEQVDSFDGLHYGPGSYDSMTRQQVAMAAARDAAGRAVADFDEHYLGAKR